jgi:hypothetical protein
MGFSGVPIVNDIGLIEIHTLSVEISLLSMGCSHCAASLHDVDHFGSSLSGAAGFEIRLLCDDILAVAEISNGGNGFSSSANCAVKKTVNNNRLSCSRTFEPIAPCLIAAKRAAGTCWRPETCKGASAHGNSFRKCSRKRSIGSGLKQKRWLRTR